MSESMKLPVGIDNFEKIRRNGFYYIDKTRLIEQLFSNWGEVNLFTRPRRFGKTLNMSMLKSFFEIGADAALFDGLYISSNKQLCDEHMGKYPVIFLSLKNGEGLDFAAAKYQMTELIGTEARRFSFLQNSDELDAYDRETYCSLCKMNGGQYVMEDHMLYASLQILSKLLYKHYGKKTVILIDEYDVPLDKAFQHGYYREMVALMRTMFGKALKTNDALQFAVLTGCLRVSKESIFTGLNNFKILSITDTRFEEQFGFTDEEVKELLTYYHVENRFSETKEWYDGYRAAAGDYLYNPRSVVCALRDNQLANYWTSSGTYDSIFNYIKGNIADVRNDLVLMVAGEHVPAKMQQYAATANALHTKDQIYSAMVVYGLLTYENGKVFIPNKELMDKFDELLLSNQQLGYVYRLARESQRMLQATIHGDTDTMEEILEYVHDTEVPIYSYNSEVELSAIVNLVYLSARDEYRVEREDKAGKGFVDFIFYPKRNNIPGIILELKIDHTPQKAIEQIKEKNYQLRFQGKIGEIPVYEGSILAVGISYDKKTKKHSCEVEML